MSGLQTGGSDPDDYLIEDGCQQPVAPSGSCQIGVRFAPQAQGGSSATLTILTNAPGQPSPVTLSGTGTAPPTGTVTCRDTALAKALCKLEFAPGTFTIQGGGQATAYFRVQRAGRTVVTGRVRTIAGRTVRHALGRLPRGRYTLIVTSGPSAHSKVLLRKAFRVR